MGTEGYEIADDGVAVHTHGDGSYDGVYADHSGSFHGDQDLVTVHEDGKTTIYSAMDGSVLDEQHYPVTVDPEEI